MWGRFLQKLGRPHWHLRHPQIFQELAEDDLITQRLGTNSPPTTSRFSIPCLDGALSSAIRLAEVEKQGVLICPAQRGQRTAVFQILPREIQGNLGESAATEKEDRKRAFMMSTTSWIGRFLSA